MNSYARAWNYILVFIGAALALVLGLGCGNADNADRRITVDSISDSAVNAQLSSDTVAMINARYQARVDEMKRTAPTQLNTCNVADHVSIALDTIMRWPQPLLGGDDNCVLRMLDELASGFVVTGDAKYLQALDSCASYSDGYVSEGLEYLTDTLFDSRPVDFVKYLHMHRNDGSPLEWLLVGEWKRNFDEKPDSNAIKTRLLAQVRKTVPRDSLTSDEIIFFDAVLRKATLIQ